MAEVYYRLKSAGGPFTRVVGTSPIEVTGLTDGEIYEYAQGDDTLAEIMPGVAPSIIATPTITGAQVGSTPVVNAGTYGGSPAPTVTPGTLELDGVAFDPPTELQPADEGKTLTYTGETASNGIAPDATQSVSETVAIGGFDPASLFTGTETGVWYDISDLSSMNTEPDQSGTAPAVGDAVRFIADKSGSGNNAQSPSLADSPILRQDANGKYYLEFDNAGDALTTDTNVNIFDDSPRELIFSHAGTANLGLGLNRGNPATRWLLFDSSGNIKLSTASGGSYNSNTSIDGVIGIRLLPGGTIGDHILSNGATDENVPGADVVGTGLGRFEIYSADAFYGCILIDRLLTASERADARQYYADLRGITR